MSFAQVAEILGRVLGRPIRAETISDDELRGSLRLAGLGELQIEAVGMSSGLRDNFIAEDERSVLTTTPTTLAAWTYTHLLPAF